MNTKISLSEVIRNARTEKKMTLRELEDKTKISFSHLSKIERGEAIPNKENIEILAEALNLDVNHLLVLSGYVPKEITVGTAQLIYDIWGDGKEEYLTPKEILLGMESSSGMLQAAASFIKESVDDDWIAFVNEMKRKNITPENLREIIRFAERVKRYVNQIEI